MQQQNTAQRQANQCNSLVLLAQRQIFHADTMNPMVLIQPQFFASRRCGQKCVNAAVTHVIAQNNASLTARAKTADNETAEVVFGFIRHVLLPPHSSKPRFAACVLFTFTIIALMPFK